MVWSRKSFEPEPLAVNKKTKTVSQISMQSKLQKIMCDNSKVSISRVKKKWIYYFMCIMSVYVYKVYVYYIHTFIVKKTTCALKINIVNDLNKSTQLRVLECT